MNFLILCLILINLIAFVVYGIDKRKAVKQQWRISEATLLGLSLIGGSVGSLAAMNVFHHKTRKLRFKIGVPVMLIGHIALAVFTAGRFM